MHVRRQDRLYTLTTKQLLFMGENIVIRYQILKTWGLHYSKLTEMLALYALYSSCN